MSRNQHHWKAQQMLWLCCYICVPFVISVLLQNTAEEQIFSVVARLDTKLLSVLWCGCFPHYWFNLTSVVEFCIFNYRCVDLTTSFTPKNILCVCVRSLILPQFLHGLPGLFCPMYSVTMCWFTASNICWWCWWHVGWWQVAGLTPTQVWMVSHLSFHLLTFRDQLAHLSW